MRLLNRLFMSNSGATAIEYGLIAALISLCMIAGFSAFTGNLGNMFSDIHASVEGAWKK